MHTCMCMRMAARVFSAGIPLYFVSLGLGCVIKFYMSPWAAWMSLVCASPACCLCVCIAKLGRAQIQMQTDADADKGRGVDLDTDSCVLNVCTVDRWFHSFLSEFGQSMPSRPPTPTCLQTHACMQMPAHASACANVMLEGQ